MAINRIQKRKDEPFEVMGHRFENFSQLMESVDVSVYAYNEGIVNGPYLCPEPHRKHKTQISKAKDIYILMISIETCFDFGWDNPWHDDGSVCISERAYTSKTYRFFFSSSPFTDAQIGSIWVLSEMQTDSLATLPYITTCVSDNYMDIVAYSPDKPKLESEDDDFLEKMVLAEGGADLQNIFTAESNPDSDEQEVLSLVFPEEEISAECPESIEDEMPKVFRTPTQADYDLYAELLAKGIVSENKVADDNEGMKVTEMLVGSWYKPHYLVDHRRKLAYEILNGHLQWAHFSTDDIDWDSIKGLPDEAKQRAGNLNASYPCFIRRYRNGVAEVEWQLIPDGRYFEDSDGYGMTDDEETALYAMVDRDLNVLEKFTFLGNDFTKADVRLKEMRQRAERTVGNEASEISM